MVTCRRRNVMFYRATFYSEKQENDWKKKSQTSVSPGNPLLSNSWNFPAGCQFYILSYWLWLSTSWAFSKSFIVIVQFDFVIIATRPRHIHAGYRRCVIANEPLKSAAYMVVRNFEFE